MPGPGDYSRSLLTEIEHQNVSCKSSTLSEDAIRLNEFAGALVGGYDKR